MKPLLIIIGILLLNSLVTGSERPATPAVSSPSQNSSTSQSGCGSTPVHKITEQRVWGCLAHANLKSVPSDPRLITFTNQLQKVFGYPHYDIVGATWGTEPANKENMVIPTKEYYAKLVPLGTDDKQIQKYSLDLYQKEKVLLKSTISMPTNAPLFIAGPVFGSGQLVFILELRQVERVDKP